MTMVGCAGSGAAPTSPSVPPSIRLEFAGERSSFVIDSLDDRSSPKAGAGRFTVHVGTIRDAPAMLGSYRRERSELWFTPRYRLKPELSYRARYRPANGGPTLERSFTIPRQELAPSTSVLQIYPSAELLPENLLRFYVEFSAPMRSGEAYRHVHLRNAGGDEVDLPFLGLPEELWDPDGRRLTLLLDPGRIKRGLMPHREVGSALRAGGSYRLTIDRDWRDAHGAPLVADFIKAFRVGPADRRQPNPHRWHISSPRANTMQPLRIEFSEPLDNALLNRMIQIIDPSGVEVAGSIEMENREAGMSFTPERVWPTGIYHLNIDVDLEDRAGNSIRSVFDRDKKAATSPIRLQVENIAVAFSITRSSRELPARVHREP